MLTAPGTYDPIMRKIGVTLADARNMVTRSPIIHFSIAQFGEL
jgi:hypothetical protein